MPTAFAKLPTKLKHLFLHRQQANCLPPGGLLPCQWLEADGLHPLQFVATRGGLVAASQEAGQGETWTHLERYVHALKTPQKWMCFQRSGCTGLINISTRLWH